MSTSSARDLRTATSSPNDPTAQLPAPRGGGSGGFGFLLAITLLAGLAAAGFLFKTTRDLEATRADRDATRSRLAHAESRARTLDTDLAATRTRAAQLESDLANAQADARDTHDQLDVERARFENDRGQLTHELENTRAQAQQNGALAERLRGLVHGGDGDTSTEGDRVTLQLVDRVLFRAGEADLTPAGIDVLRRVAEVLQQFPDKQIWVQGHTDIAAPPHPERFASNWELSSARALSVVHFLQDQAHIDPQRLAAVGFSQYRPRSNHASARNRRIEIVLAPMDVRLQRAHR
jgi:chemotaxis protein MotB